MPILRPYRRCCGVAWTNNTFPLVTPRPEDEVVLREGEELVGALLEVGRILGTTPTWMSIRCSLVRMAKRLGRARDQELAWDEEVMGHGVRRQLREITVAHRAEFRTVGGG